MAEDSSSTSPLSDGEQTVPYHALVDEKLGRVWDKFKSIEAAIAKADMDLTAYKLTANEFRGTLSDQAQRLATKDELRQRDTALELQRLRIEKIENASSNLQGRIWMLAAIIAVFQIVLNLAPKFFPHVP